MRVNITSLLPSALALATRNIETPRVAPGPNPNLNTSIKFKCKLPIEELYCPSLTCEIFDYIFMGLSQPLIGTFCIPIGEIKK